MVAITGVLGAGKSRLLSAIFGADGRLPTATCASTAALSAENSGARQSQPVSPWRPKTGTGRR